LSRPGHARLILQLTAGILAVSCGSIFVRLASAPALAIAAYRMVWATLLFAPFLLRGPARDLTRLGRREWLRLLLSGTALALHFGLWIASLSYTSVASSVLLVDTAPFFIGLAATWILREPCPRSFWIGLAVAFTGCVMVFHNDWSASADNLTGNALALAGAAAMAVYLLIGARARQNLSLIGYVWPVYGSAAVVLFAACIVFSVPVRGFSQTTHILLFLLALVPQCIGHTTYNWSLRWLSPGMVALIGLAEPVGASILARIVLGETLSIGKMIGGGIILAGIYLATRQGRSDSLPPSRSLRTIKKGVSCETPF
jgi:drug/metabolite transporter (DMT)-like permease